MSKSSWVAPLPCPRCRKPIVSREDALQKAGYIYFHKACAAEDDKEKGGSNTNEQQEICPTCSKLVENKDNAIIKAGVMYHRQCVQLDIGKPEQRKKSEDESCPICNESVTSDYVIKGGRMHHRKCLIVEQEPEKSKIRNEENCPVCNQPVESSGDSVVIKAGRMHHRKCIIVEHQMCCS
eukprot:TRINITY_DN1150_c0_g1_i8.p1 TRINITY_DN1150_c0_g1~~TRINITY_DN1150_c0_g1_i8.p1  ORF type:complete len:180 (-),score=25.63 TRINITY_DN1150_c0_g1_i8:504-1043(-)